MSVVMVSQESNGGNYDYDQQHEQEQQQPRVQKCFTSIQQRKFWSSSSSSQFRSHNIRLCPSMDLLAYEVDQEQQQQQQSTSSSSLSSSSIPNIQLNIHRTLNFQKIASVVLSSSSSPSDDEDQPIPHYNKKHQVSLEINNGKRLYNTMEWRPDGRFIAVAVHRTVHIYSIEGLLMVSESTTNAGAGTEDIASGRSDVSGISTSVVCNNNDPASSSNVRSSENDSTSVLNGGKVCSFIIPSPYGDDDHTEVITSLSWVHLGHWCEHKMWPSTEPNYRNNYNSYIQEQQLYQPQQYIDRWTYALPPSAYHYESHSISDYYDENTNISNDQNNTDYSITPPTTTSNGTIPNTQTPISILCVLTSSGYLSMYVHGRYKVASNISLLPTTIHNHGLVSSKSFNFLPIVTSPDLTHYITATLQPSGSNQNNSTTMVLTILSFPELSKNRQHYQMISTLYGSISHHIRTIRTNLPAINATWKNTLRPFDTKLDGLQKLFLNYGLITSTLSSTLNNTVRSLLLQYVLSGHTRAAPTLSNAIDQFFTSVQMNDQLTQRMGQALFQSIVQIEVSIRKLLVAPATALVYDIDQLYGLSSYRPDILSTDDTLQLLFSAQHLLLVVNVALTTLIEARSRLRDFVAWIRSTGANIKARGTANNSVQRENAKKRQINEVTLQRLLCTLQENRKNYNNNNGKEQNGGSLGLIEDILNLGLAEILCESPAIMDMNTKENQTLDQLPYKAKQENRSMNASTVVEMIEYLFDKVFESPCAFATQTVQRTNIQLLCDDPPSHGRHGFHGMAITTRIGQGSIDSDDIPFGDSPPRGFFSPRSAHDSYSSSNPIRQWLIITQQQRSNAIQLRAFPLTWTNTVDDEFDDDPTVADGLDSESFWTIYLDLPSECRVRSTAFYSDNGKSTLSSTCDVGNTIGGQEGRQQLGLLVSRSKLNGTRDESVELWLIPYDDLEFSIQTVVQASTQSDYDEINYTTPTDDTRTMSNVLHYTVLPMCDDPYARESTHDTQAILYARTRCVIDAVDYASTKFKDCSMVLSGSRGIAAVTLDHYDCALLEILDVEDDEEEEGDPIGEDE